MLNLPCYVQDLLIFIFLKTVTLRKKVLISNLKYSLLFSIEIIVFILQLSLNVSFLRNQVNIVQLSDLVLSDALS